MFMNKSIKMKKAFLIFLLLVLSMNVMIAQNRTVRGTVTDAVTGKPLAGVNVLLKDKGKGVITNSEGNYRIRTSAEGEKLLFIYHGKARKEVEIDEKAFISVQLGPENEHRR